MTACLIRLSAAIAVAVFSVVSLPAQAAMFAGKKPVLAQDADIVLVAKKKKSARQAEIDRSVDNGTVPSRYRKSVPARYHRYIPFER